MTEIKPAQDHAEEVERIKARITALVNDRFSRGSEMYYLSQLGTDLGADRRALERLSHRKLRQFVEEALTFTIKVTGQNQNVFYIARDATTTSASETPRRYNRSFWLAFAVSLMEDNRRFLNLDTQRFGPDEASLRKVGGDVREIVADYLRQPGEPGDPQSIAEKISRWLSDQELDPAPFLLTQKQRAAFSAQRSALDMLLESLDNDQLKRVNLPLDIVQALKARTVR